MPVAAWIRERLWRSSDWSSELARLRQELASGPKTARTVERTLELATALEYCDPDRSHALALYVDAWRSGLAVAAAPAITLARALRAHMTVAELALGTGAVGDAAAAFLDAGFAELALEPLQKFVEAKGTLAAPILPEHAPTLLAMLRSQRVDAEREISDALDRAGQQKGRAAAQLYVHAARIARLARLAPRFEAILAAAERVCPDDREVAALVEARLLERANADELLAYYRARFERAPTRAEYVERVRSAGIELIARNLQPGLGLRMLRMALEAAYETKLPDLPAHVAVWELMAGHARTQRSTLDLVPLVVQALASPLSEDAALYLSRLGLEIAWRDANDLLAAQPYAAQVLDFVPDHPFAIEFAKVAMPEAIPAPVVAKPAPVPRTRGAMPAIAKPAPPPEAPRATSRIPKLDQGQVKRSVAPVSLTPAARGISGRLALLKPPPPRATSLKRDTSPFPMAPLPRTITAARAPRKVVPVDAVVELPTGSFFSTVLRDVSTSGAFIVTKRTLEIGAIVALEMRVPTPGSLGQTSHRANARVVRQTDVGFGVAFVDAAPELVDALRIATE